MSYDHDSYISRGSKLQAVKFPELLLGDKPLELGTCPGGCFTLLSYCLNQKGKFEIITPFKDVEPC